MKNERIHMNVSIVLMIIKSQLITWKKDDFFSHFKKEHPNNSEIKRTRENNKVFNIKNGEDLTKLYLKSDVVLSFGWSWFEIPR